MGDIFPAPVSHRASGISGVEIMSNLLQSVREGRVLQTARPWQTALASALPVLLLCLALPRLSPRQAVLCSAALLAAMLAAAVAASISSVIAMIRSRSEEHTSELQSLMRISYAVFCLKKKKKIRLKQTISAIGKQT